MCIMTLVTGGAGDSPMTVSKFRYADDEDETTATARDGDLGE